MKSYPFFWAAVVESEAMENDADIDVDVDDDDDVASVSRSRRLKFPDEGKNLPPKK